MPAPHPLAKTFKYLGQTHKLLDGLKSVRGRYTLTGFRPGMGRTLIGAHGVVPSRALRKRDPFKSPLIVLPPIRLCHRNGRLYTGVSTTRYALGKSNRSLHRGGAKHPLFWNRGTVGNQLEWSTRAQLLDS